MNDLLAQFRNLNTRDPGSWPALPKFALLAALLVAILVVAYFYDWQDQLDALEAGRQLEVKLKEEYKSKKAQSVNLDLYRQQLQEIESSFGALLKQLPNKSQMEALLVDINQAGLGRGLQFDLFRRRTKRSRSSTRSCRSPCGSPATTMTWARSRATSVSCRGS
jgi:type IV pilus assembly protein PilO